jgi:pimeloyl-ACP methyl ester carboxylesterase
MTSTKPTIIMVPGAWHPASCFDAIASSLQSHSYKTIQITTPTVGSTLPFSADVKAIRSAISDSADKGEEVLLFMHSYGGVPGCCAVEGLSRESLAQTGKRGGVVGLVFCTAWMLDVGEAILSNPIVNSSKARGVSDDPMEVWKPRGGPAHCFYNDMNAMEQERWVGMLKHHSFDTVMRSEVTYAAWKHVPTTYIFCTEDNTIIYQTQQNLVERARKEGSHLRTERLDASHSPFLSMPEAVVDCVRRAALEDDF